MDGLYDNQYRIKSSRCCNWDYGSDGKYFITIITAGREWHFGFITKNTMVLSPAGRIANYFWNEIPNHFSFIRLDAFVVMPDHIHGILIIDKNGCHQNVATGLPVGEPFGAGAAVVDTAAGTAVVETRQCLVSTMTGPGSGTNRFAGDCRRPGQSIGSARVRNPGKNNISTVIGSYKSICTRTIHEQLPELKFGWQSRFHDHIIRNDEEYTRIRRYILNNPKNWKY